MLGGVARATVGRVPVFGPAIASATTQVILQHANNNIRNRQRTADTHTGKQALAIYKYLLKLPKFKLCFFPQMKKYTYLSPNFTIHNFKLKEIKK